MTTTAEAPTLGEGWLEVSRLILEDGADATYDGLATKEVAHLTLVVAEPEPGDGTIAALGDPDRLEWMRRAPRRPRQVGARLRAGVGGDARYL